MSNLFLCQTGYDDLDYVLEAERHPDNSPYVGQWTREEHIDAYNNPDILHITVKCKEADELISVGYVIIAGLQDINQSIELRRLVITEKGKGYGRETLRLIKKLAFEKCKAHRLWLDVHFN